MKKATALLFLCLLLAGTFPLPAEAETFYGDNSWNVTYDGSKMVSSFQPVDIDNVIGQLEPGDAAIIHLTLKNTSVKTTHWYMGNELLRALGGSLKATEGGVYGYTLTYASPSGEMMAFFDSDAVGGDGLSDGSERLSDKAEDCFYLGELGPNQAGTVTLGVRLDSKALGSGYRDTLVKIPIRFSVEETTDASPIPKTGDPSRMLLSALVMPVSGLLLGIVMMRWHKKGKMV